MRRRFPEVCCALLTAAFAFGCSKTAVPSAAMPAAAAASESSTAAHAQSAAPQSDRDAITAAIQQHLSENKGINMSAMTMNVSNVTISGEQAQADAEFLLKQGGTSMLITYYLERHGGGWLVTRNQPRGDSQFAHPPMDQVHSGAGNTVPDAARANSPGAAPGASSQLPDVSTFFKNHPAPKSN